MLAVRPSWVRVNSADGTVLFEKILDAGERYALPPLEMRGVPHRQFRLGLFRGGTHHTYGPAAPGADAVKDIALAPDALVQKFALADLTADDDLAKVMTADASSVAAPAGDAPVE